MSLTPCVSVWGFFVSLPTSFVTPYAHTFFMNMSMNINNFGGTINYNDHHKEFTISGASTNVSEIVRSFFSEDITPVQEVEPKQNTNFPFIVSVKLEELGLYSLEEFQCLYREAIGGNAKTLASFLKKYHELKVLDFEGKNKKQIFTKLQECFPDQISYDYNNFISYF